MTKRDGKWWLSAYSFLNKINPERYALVRNSYLEGTFIHYHCYDRHAPCRLGPVVIWRAVVNSYELHPDPNREEK